MSKILWEGRVAVVGKLFVKQRYCLIYEDRISFLRKNDPSSPEEFSYNFKEIKEVLFPSQSPTELIIGGYKGFTLCFAEGTIPNQFRFYPNSFGAYPKSEEIVKVREIFLEKFNFSEEQKVELSNQKVTSAGVMLAYVLGLFALVIVCGWLNAAILLFGLSIIFRIRGNKELSPSTANLYTVAVALISIALTVVITVLAVWYKLNG